MPFWKHTYHIVWATKNRQPWIVSAYEGQLYAFLASKAGELDCYLHAIGVTEDHVHDCRNTAQAQRRLVCKDAEGIQCLFHQHGIVVVTVSFRLATWVWQSDHRRTTERDGDCLCQFAEGSPSKRHDNCVAGTMSRRGAQQCRLTQAICLS